MEPGDLHGPCAADLEAPQREWIEDKRGYEAVAKRPTPFHHTP